MSAEEQARRIAMFSALCLATGLMVGGHPLSGALVLIVTWVCMYPERWL